MKKKKHRVRRSSLYNTRAPETYEKFKKKINTAGLNIMICHTSTVRPSVVGSRRCFGRNECIQISLLAQGCLYILCIKKNVHNMYMYICHIHIYIRRRTN